MHINIDGVPLFNSLKMYLWPILGSIQEVPAFVFPIAVYYSKQKPCSIDNYLTDFVCEIKSLKECGFCFSDSNDIKHFQIKLDAVINDAPVRSFLKCIKPLTAYSCCERCMQAAEWHGKIVFPDFSTPLRTDAGFLAQEDSKHHCGISPFTQLGCAMIHARPLDCMHLVCLGVMHRLIHLWLRGPHTCRLSQNLLSGISDRLILIQSFISKKISTKPRALNEYKMWKATELRLCTGPVVLKGLLSPDMYSSYLDLSIAIHLLLSESRTC